MTRNEIEALLRKKAKELGAEEDLPLLMAMVSVESSWNPSAVRYEPNYKFGLSVPIFAKKNGISADTEGVFQKMSWGLFQVMGCGLRELGYSDSLLGALDPEKNIELGITFFLKRCKKYQTIDQQIAAYNAGTPPKKDKDGKYPERVQNHVDKVLKAYISYLQLNK